MTKNIIVTVLLSGASLAFVGWRVHAMRAPSPQFSILEDFSLSHAHGCDSLVELATQVLNSNQATQDSTLTVLALGDQATADEPRLMARYSIPRRQRVLETENDEAQQQRAVLGDIRNRCRGFGRTTVSPIFLGVKEAVADLRAHGCRPNSQCQLLVDTDLEDNVEPFIGRSLHHPSRARDLPPRIANDGIEITFCGLATRDHFVVRHHEAHRHLSPTLDGDLTHSIWRSLFTNSGAVGFEPYCAD
jgi:hypothetical protein